MVTLVAFFLFLEFTHMMIALLREVASFILELRKLSMEIRILERSAQLSELEYFLSLHKAMNELNQK